jgi:hypothetical protein
MACQIDSFRARFFLIEIARACTQYSDISRLKSGKIKMLSYATLLLVSLGALLAVTLIYKTIQLIYKSASRFCSPASRSNKQAIFKKHSSMRPRNSTISSAIDGSLAPMERRIQKASWNEVSVNAVNSGGNGNQDFAWLKREKTSALSEKSYSVKRRYTPKTPTLESVSKPFKRKVAPWVLEYGNQNKAATPNIETK